VVVLVVFFTIFFLFYMDFVRVAVESWAGPLTGDKEEKARYWMYLLGKGLAFLAV